MVAGGAWLDVKDNLISIGHRTVVATVLERTLGQQRERIGATLGGCDFFNNRLRACRLACRCSMSWKRCRRRGFRRDRC